MTTITTIQAADLITNSRAVINTNFANLNSDKIETSVLDTDTTLAADSDAKIPSQKAVKAYIDTTGNANASTTARGIVEEATVAEIDAGTAAGATGARLFVNPSTFKTSQIPITRTYLNAGSPATWSKPAGLKYVVVEVQAGGGGGGGETTAARAGGGGGGGGYSRKTIAVATLGATETVTTGVGGTAGAGTGGTGGTGGTSSFGAHATATGGAGGVAGGSVNLGGVAGAGASGDFNIEGGDGGTGIGLAAQCTSGHGGNSYFGGGGSSLALTTSGATVGVDGNVYGGGGGGCVNQDASDRAGGVGAAGIVIVTEYYS